MQYRAMFILINARLVPTYAGVSVVNEELSREAPEDSQTRMNATARYFKDTVHDIGLEDWIAAHGGTVSISPPPPPVIVSREHSGIVQ